MFDKSESLVLEPPRLLAGVMLLFWGAMCGEAVLGLIAAILLEGKNWVKLSWDFGDGAYVRAFWVFLGLVGLLILMIWVNDEGGDSLYQLMKWFPLYALPVELAQRYGVRRTMNLNTFFYFSRSKMKRELRGGMRVNPRQVNTGYLYLFGVLVVSSCSDTFNVYVNVAMFFLLGVLLVSAVGSAGYGLRRLIWAVPVVVVGVLLMQSEFAVLYKYFAGRGLHLGDTGGSGSSVHRSVLGQLGDIKQSKEIQWRMWGDDVPEYLRLNSYNRHHGVMWSYDYRAGGFNKMEDSFDSRIGVAASGLSSDVLFFESGHDEILQKRGGDMGKVRLRGGGQTDTVESVVPSAGGMLAVGEIAGDDVRAAVHPLGVLKLVNRDSIIDYTMWMDDGEYLDSDPDGEIDLNIDDSCKEAVRELSDEMGLSRVGSVEGKVALIRGFFENEFRYSLHFDVPETGHYQSDIVRFMDKSCRQGHCEYFATTAALLLRYQGVPARYCVGYVARERSGDAWVMRGVHAHAWCSVWMDGRWEVVDLTPPDWLSLEGDQMEMGWFQVFKDLFKTLKQDFLIWSSRSENKFLVSLVLWGLGLVLLVWAIYRLFKVRNKGGEEVEGSKLVYRGSDVFDGIEGRLSDLIGERSVSETYRSWVSGSADRMDEALLVEVSGLIALYEESRYGGVDVADKIRVKRGEVKTLLK